LVPIVIVISALCHRRGEPAREERQPLVPFFLIGFICMMVANSLHLIPSVAAEGINSASRICLVLAIAALGVKTSFQALASLGWRAVVMLVAETVWIALLVQGALHLTT